MDNICPYLGMINDSETSTLFPDNCNTCYRADPPQPVAITHQREHCLVGQHTECEGFVNGWEDGFPRALRNKNCRNGTKFWKNAFRRIPPVYIIGGVLLVALILLGVFLIIPNLRSAPAATLDDGISANNIVGTATEQAPTATQTPIATFTRTAIPEPTSTPTPDYTPTQTPGPALKTPFGGEELWLLIHQIQAEETLTAIANLYSTTIDVLWNLNGLAFRTIQMGDHIVVCLDCEDMPDLPPLQAIYLDESATLSDLASAYDAAINDLRLWNDLGEEDWVGRERWIVVPIEIEADD